HLVSKRTSAVAAAAGGFMFLPREVLESLGGFATMKDALIDDCTLARKIKMAGHGIWLGVSRSAQSLRPYATLSSFWNMVARSAFTQLRYSLVMLMLTTGLMLALFCGPWMGLFASTKWLGLLGLGAM